MTPIREADVVLVVLRKSYRCTNCGDWVWALGTSRWMREQCQGCGSGIQIVVVEGRQIVSSL